MTRASLLQTATLLSLSLLACGPAPQEGQAQTQETQAASVAAASDAAAVPAGALSVTATTSVIGDFVWAVGGDRVTVQTLVPAGSDAHTFSPSPGSIRTLAQSRALFANGAGLEGWLDQASAAAPDVPAYRLAEQLPLHTSETEAGGGDHTHGDHDPHAWWDADLAAAYLDEIAATLSQLDPAGAETYRQNARAYAAEIRSVDEYGQQQFAALPPEQRRVAATHGGLNYFAERYGLELVGTVIPGLSTEREPSAQDLAALATRMREQNVHVILTENVVAGSDRLAQALAAETGAVVAPPIYTDALGPAGSPGETFPGALRHNIDTIVAALKQAAAH
ncbi:metal ABC transporter substrate-binding protein [Deinococcus sp. Marseille-Q6407]|uniref:metal ABC transporter substrate-binding protein n=1 Tax=Deinococcus sp. Marseille-Q6407 TaxID=2969223 RepID=UPI0021C1B786|nr:metal ABC transporter substrate-binding protein [Deinococcus sp. Marseille-Q6407]